MSNYYRFETPPTGFTLTEKRPRSASKEKRERKKPKEQQKQTASSQPGVLILPSSPGATGGEIDPNSPITPPPVLPNIPLSQQIRTYQRGLPNANSSNSDVSETDFEVRNVFSSNSNKNNRELKRRNDRKLTRSISFTAKPVKHSFEDLTDKNGYNSMFETRRQSVSVPDLFRFGKPTKPKQPAKVPTGTVASYSFEQEGFGDGEDTGTSLQNLRPDGWTWKNKIDFAILCICQALGLSNVWRFPYFCYSNGGGSFLCAYIILMAACSAPLLCMELAVGQVTQAQAIMAFKRLCPLMKGVGLAGIAATFWLSSCYSVVISWGMFYFFNSLYSVPRWLQCDHAWNTKECQENPSPPPNVAHYDSNGTFIPAVTHYYHPITGMKVLGVPKSNVTKNLTTPAVEFFNLKMLESTKGIDSLGDLRFELFAAMLFAWIFIFVAVRKPTFLVGHTRYTMALVPNILFLVLIFEVCAFEGSQSGIYYLLVPQWEGLQNIKVWLYALAQTIHSLGVVFGFGIAVGSCDNQYYNMFRGTTISVLSNLYVQLIVSCIVFGTIGHLSFKFNTPIETTLQHDPGLVFLAFSELTALLPVPTFWAIACFIVIFCLAMDSQVTLMQTLLTALKEVYNDFIKHYFHAQAIFLLLLCVLSLLISTPYVSQSGIYFFQLTDHYVSVLSTNILALLEFVIISWIYGAGNLSVSIKDMTGKKPPFILIFLWLMLGPLTIVVILLIYLILSSNVPIRDGYSYPKWAISLGWLLVCLTLGSLPFCAISALRDSAKEDGENRFKGALRPTPAPVRRPTIFTPQPIIVLRSPVYGPPQSFAFTTNTGDYIYETDDEYESSSDMRV